MNEPSDQLKKLLADMRPSDDELAQMVRETQDFMANLLQQEYKKHEGAWWLWSLGKPARPLQEDEIKFHRERGDLNE